MTRGATTSDGPVKDKGKCHRFSKVDHYKRDYRKIKQ